MTHTNTSAETVGTAMKTTPEYVVLWGTVTKELIWIETTGSGNPVVAKANKNTFVIKGGTDPYNVYGQASFELFGAVVAAHQALSVGADISYLATHRIGTSAKGEPEYVPLPEAQAQA